MCSHMLDFNARNKSLTAKLLQQGCRSICNSSCSPGGTLVPIASVSVLLPIYVVPNVLSPRDLVFRPDIMDETVKSSYTLRNVVEITYSK